jgi:hypothetical protein
MWDIRGSAMCSWCVHELIVIEDVY